MHPHPIYSLTPTLQYSLTTQNAPPPHIQSHTHTTVFPHYTKCTPTPIYSLTPTLQYTLTTQNAPPPPYTLTTDVSTKILAIFSPEQYKLTSQIDTAARLIAQSILSADQKHNMYMNMNTNMNMNSHSAVKQLCTFQTALT